MLVVAETRGPTHNCYNMSPATTARTVTVVVFGLDVLFILSLAFETAVNPPSGGPFDVGAAVWGLMLAAPYVAATIVLLSGEGVTKGRFAEVMAWLTGIALPLLVMLILALSWTPGPVRKQWEFVGSAVLGSVIHLLIPASTRWVRDGGSFLPILWRMTRVLLIAATAVVILFVFS